MHRIYELLQQLFKEKINIFIRGSITGGTLIGIFLFGSSFHDHTSFIVAYFVKALAVAVSAFISGFVTVLGNDAVKWTKAKFASCRKSAKRRRAKRAA